jgi:hypothetical protein
VEEKEKNKEGKKEPTEEKQAVQLKYRCPCLNGFALHDETRGFPLSVRNTCL